ncbi:MAG TPA: hypothetical protein VLF17_07765 [Candidatus Nitrosotenuis sp.]|nr:hypothetical protein [Candidatus Nitrosotenuis sp.]
MKSLPKSQESSKDPPTEFDGIMRLSNVDQITIDELERAQESTCSLQGGQKVRDLLEQKMALAIEPYVLEVLQENKANVILQHHDIGQINSILQKIAFPMSAQTTCYFRAGRAYLRITHELGDVGNLFFKSLFHNILKNSGKSYHIQAQENTVCAICRV